ncbi:Serine/threonine-protein phosphatase rdgC [Bienertia sinuspersici]
MTVPMWVHIDAHYKYWGMKNLEKLTRIVGEMLGVDQATTNRDRLTYARCKVEVSVAQVFPNQVTFLDEKISKQTVVITYERRPNKCEKCKAIGHTTGQCKRVATIKPTKQWRPNANT